MALATVANGVGTVRNGAVHHVRQVHQVERGRVALKDLEVLFWQSFWHFWQVVPHAGRYTSSPLSERDRGD